MRKQYKIPFYKKEYVKNELYQYWDNKELLSELESEILDKGPAPADGQPRGNTAGNPTERKAIKITELKSTKNILIAEKKIRSIERAFNKLVPEEMELVKLIFKEGRSQIYTQMNNNISKDQYYNTMNKIIYITAKELGEI